MPIPAMPSLAPPDPPLQVVLVSPQIPPNTGNVARTCAVTGCVLHLVGPLGFSLDEASLRRAGLDYWAALAPRVHRDWAAFDASELPPIPGVVPAPPRYRVAEAMTPRVSIVNYVTPEVKDFYRSPLGVPFWWQTWLSK